MSLPAIRAVREAHPRAHLAVLARPWVADIYARESAIDEVIPYTAAKGARDWGAKWKLAGELRRHRFDWAILLQNAFEAAALVFAAGIPRRIGYARDGRAWLLTDAVTVPAPGDLPPHERFYYLELLRRAGIIAALPECDAIRLEGRAAAAAVGAARLTGATLGVSPGAAFGNAKRWIPERFAEAAARLARDCGLSVALFGSKDERGVCESISEQLAAAGVAAHNFAGETSLAEFIELAAACELFLTNDSGAMHIASALGVPTVTVFGATNHITTGPTGALARMIRHDVECSPCQLRECPIDHRCMTGVTVDEVTAMATAIWKQSGH